MRTWCAERLKQLRCEGKSSGDTSASAGAKGNGIEIKNEETILTDENSQNAGGISGASLSRLKDESDALRSRLDELRLVCGEQSVQVAALALRNDERHQRLQEERRRVEAARLGLDGIWVGVLGGGGDDDHDAKVDGGDAIRENELEKARGHAEAAVVDGLPGAISSLVSEVRSRRLALALQAFDAHRIDIGPDCSNTVQNSNDEDTVEGHDADETGAKARAAARRERMRRRPRGVGKICALPLPHAGPALYGVLPPAVLASSLRLVSSLTVVLSRCLGIALPHPIFLRPLIASSTTSTSSSSSRAKARAAAALAHAQRKECGDIIETVDNGEVLEYMLALNGGDDTEDVISNGNTTSSSSGSQALLSSASSMRTLGRTARWALAKATGHSTTTSEVAAAKSPSSTSASNAVMSEAPPMYSNLSNAKQTYNAPIDKATMANQIRHAAAAVIWEGSDGTGGEYTLIPPGWTGAPVRTRSPEDDFATGLQLLQNDVVALCIRAGVQVSDMWPAEALLLNLDLLRIHLSSQADEENSSA